LTGSPVYPFACGHISKSVNFIEHHRKNLLTANYKLRTAFFSRLIERLSGPAAACPFLVDSWQFAGISRLHSRNTLVFAIIT
jgi:hypothetical protein